MDRIDAREITKAYRMGVGRARVREMLPWPVDRGFRRLFPRWWAKDSFNALEDATLRVPAGSSVGIVGHNGAGKTTLLKVLAGVTSPSSGRLNVSGRTVALIDILIGVHPDLTGRENAYLLGAIHGYGRRAMNTRMDRIFNFAEIEGMSDTPLKRYSAGMVARLGFATITALDMELLLVDEVLAVGDGDFQGKCIRWLDEYRAAGGTILLVSHNLGLIRSMSERTVWLHRGRILADGPTDEILSMYGRAMEHRDDEQQPSALAPDAQKVLVTRGLYRWGAGGVRVEEAHVEGPVGDEGALTITIAYEASILDSAVFCVGFVDEAGREVGGTASRPIPIEGPRGEIRCAIRPLPLRSGIYFPVVGILSSDGLVRDRWRLDRAVVVERLEQGWADVFGPVDIPATWASSAAPADDGPTVEIAR